MPFSILYGWGTALRNWAYDKGWKKSKDYDIPILCVGNIAAGGTGKTPFVAYLLEKLIAKGYRVAVVSRGYKRKSKGLQIASEESSAAQLGDEPYLLYRRYPQAIIAVDANRQRAIDFLSVLPREERPHVIIMDDGYQHRSVTPHLSILLTRYDCPYYEDRLLPLGGLRESPKSRLRAKIVIVTKCPPCISPMDMRIMDRNLDLFAHQKIYYMSADVLPPRSVFSLPANAPSLTLSSPTVLCAGIASPQHFFEGAKKHFTRVAEECAWADHHFFDDEEIDKINDWAEDHFIITTEKDAVRLIDMKESLSEEARSKIYYLPLKIAFLRHEEDTFLANITEEISSKIKNQPLTNNSFSSKK